MRTSMWLVLVLAGCGGAETTPTPPPPEPHACTEMACSDGATVSAAVAAADALVGTHTFAVEVDGQTQTCTVAFASLTEAAYGTCTQGASISLAPVMRQVVDDSLVPGVVGISETPVPGQFAWHLSLSGRPAHAHVVHTFDGRTISDHGEALTYGEVRPNGEGCEPVCQQANADWDVSVPMPGGVDS